MLLSGTGSGTAVHLSAVVGPGEIGRDAVPEHYRRAWDGGPSLDGYDLQELAQQQWSPVTLCGREWLGMALAEGRAIYWPDDDLVYAPTCKRCLSLMDRHFPAPAPAPHLPLVVELITELRHYPALLAAWTVGVAAVLAGREELLARALTIPRFDDPMRSRAPLPAAAFLNQSVLMRDAMLYLAHNQLGPLGDFPQSRLLRAEVREPVRGIEPDDDTYQQACSRFELLASMVSNDAWAQAGAQPEERYPWIGEYTRDRGWGTDHGLAARIEREISSDWPMFKAGAFDGAEDRARAALSAVVGWGKTY